MCEVMYAPGMTYNNPSPPQTFRYIVGRQMSLPIPVGNMVQYQQQTQQYVYVNSPPASPNNNSGRFLNSNNVNNVNKVVRFNSVPQCTTPTTPKSRCASGASTVAIDNKIEQAMDLVKSHLMFAVREEVEVLKEKISELMDRINQLEYENNILRAHASPETLNLLSNSQAPKQPQPASTTS